MQLTTSVKRDFVYPRCSTPGDLPSANWQAPPARAVVEGDSRLKLRGITLGGRVPLALINGKSLSEGESATIPVKSGTIHIQCLKIQSDSVLISVERENSPRLLHLK